MVHLCRRQRGYAISTPGSSGSLKTLLRDVRLILWVGRDGYKTVGKAEGARACSQSPYEDGDLYEAARHLEVLRGVVDEPRRRVSSSGHV